MARRLLRGLRLALARLPGVPNLDRLLGVVSGTILAWNALPGLFPASGPDWIASVLAGVQSGSLGALVPLCLSVLLLGLVVVATIPRVYVGPLSEPIGRHSRVRMVLGAYAFAVGAVFYLWGLSVGGSSLPAGLPGPPQWLLNATMLSGFLPVGVALSRVESRPIHHPDNYFARPLVGLSTADDSAAGWRADFETLAGRPRLRPLVSLLVAAAGTSVFVVPATLLGIFVGTLSLYYPVIEIVALVGAVGSWVLRRDRTPAPDSPIGGGLDAARDVDSSFYRQLRTAVTPRAWGVFLPVLLGVLFAVAPLLLAGAYHTPTTAFSPSALLGAYWSLAELRTLGTLGYAVDVTGDAAVWAALSLTPLVVVCYCLWYWFRTVRRIPTLLYHADAASVRAHLDETAKTPNVSRPKGLLLPLCLVVWAWLSHRFTWGAAFVPIPLARGEFGFLLVWSVGIGVLAWTVYEAVQSAPTVPESPVREIYVPLGVQILVVMDMGLDRVIELGSLLTLLVLFVSLYYLFPRAEVLFDLPRSRRILAFASVGSTFGFLLWLQYDVGLSLLLGAAVFVVFVLGGEWHDLIEESD
jgi:hypothetical protein